MGFLEPIYFSVKTEVSSAYFSDLLVFIYQGYIVPLYHNFKNVRRWVINDKEVLAFTFLDPRGLWSVDIEIAIGNPIEVKMTSNSSEVPKAVLNNLKEDLIIIIQLFEEKVRKTTLYFAWVPRRGVMPEKNLDKRRKVLNQIFMGNMLLFFVIFLILSYGLFFVATEIFSIPLLYFPIILLVVQLFVVLFSDKIIGRMGDWSITAESPHIYILQYHIPPEEFESFRQKYTKDDLLQIKKEIYERTLALGRPIESQEAQEVFFNHGINLRPENLLAKTMNMFQIVKDVADRFNMNVPKIKISNVIIPNAAATGPSPRFGLMLITTGLLVQLDEEEVSAVVGHEISHLKERDPLVLFALASTEYLLRVYFIWQFIFFLGFFYIFLALAGVYFIAKFFEARADLESAIKLGQPKNLASALRKIGYRRIQLERLSSSAVGRWLGMDPHPPVSFRIERLENLREPSKIKHPFIQSMKDCINGLLSELKKI